MRAEPYPRSYYVASANPSPERPPLGGDAACDVCVVGGGFTGLSAALALAERGYDVVLLEANRIGWGASGRNGGQLGSGQRMAPSAMVRRFGLAEAKRLWDLAEEAKAIVKDRIARHAIACNLKAGHLAVAAKPADVGWLKRELEVVQERFGYAESCFVAKAELGRYLGSERYHGGVFDRGAGHLHPLNYALGLAEAAAAAGVRLFEGTPALSLAGGGRPTIDTEAGSVRAKAVVLACNGYLGRLERRIAGAILPIANYVIATAPLGARAAEVIPADCCVHDTRFVVDYYRLSADGRLLFGGGETYTGGGPRDIPAFVRPYMLRVFPQLADVAIDYGWAACSRSPSIGCRTSAGWPAMSTLPTASRATGWR